MEKENKERTTIWFTPSIKNYLEEESNAFGMSISSFLTMIINMYRQQTKSLTELSNLEGYLKRMEDLIKQNDNKL